MEKRRFAEVGNLYYGAEMEDGALLLACFNRMSGALDVVITPHGNRPRKAITLTAETLYNTVLDYNAPHVDPPRPTPRSLSTKPLTQIAREVSTNIVEYLRSVDVRLFQEQEKAIRNIVWVDLSMQFDDYNAPDPDAQRDDQKTEAAIATD